MTVIVYFPYHYFHIIYSIFIIFLSVIIVRFLPSRISTIILSIIMVLFITSQVLWNAYLRPHTNKIDSEIIQNINNAKKSGYTNVFIIFSDETEHGHLKSAFFNPEAREPISAFSTWWSTSYLLRYIYRFRNVVITNGSAKLLNNDNKSFKILSDIIYYNNEQYSSVNMNKSNTLFIYPSINPLNNNSLKINYYYSYDEFIYQKDNRELNRFDTQIIQTNNRNNNEMYLLYASLVYVSAGESNNFRMIFPDKKYSEDKDNTINYGLFSGDNLLSTYDLSNIYGSNRYGRSFTYRFSGLPETELGLTFDIHEIWKKAPDERVFSITVETYQGIRYLENIDPFALGVTGKEVSPVRFLITIPDTSFVNITFTANENMPNDHSSCPFINAIGIVYLKRNDISCSIEEEDYIDILAGSALIFIDAGIDHIQKHENIAADASYDSNVSNNGIRYGYEGYGFASVYGDDINQSNRYGPSFSYHFENIPHNTEGYTLVLLSDEIWKTAPGQREFSVNIETDNDMFYVETLDTYLLKTFDSKSGIFEYDIPSSSTLKVTFTTREDLLQYGTDSLAFINAIGLIPR